MLDRFDKIFIKGWKFLFKTGLQFGMYFIIFRVFLFIYDKFGFERLVIIMYIGIGFSITTATMRLFKYLEFISKQLKQINDEKVKSNENK